MYARNVAMLNVGLCYTQEECMHVCAHACVHVSMLNVRLFYTSLVPVICVCTQACMYVFRYAACGSLAYKWVSA